MRMIRWFNVTKVDPPSEEPPPDNPILTLYDYVMEEDDIPYYRLFKYGSIIEIYDVMPTYFLARQDVVDWRTRTKALHAEYRLTLTDDAKKIVNALLKAPFICDVNKDTILTYECSTTHPTVFIPIPNSTESRVELHKGAWVTIISIEPKIPNPGHMVSATTIPFNCGPLKPLWNKAVECWIDEIAKLAPTLIEIDDLRPKLLKYKYLSVLIIPAYSIQY